jgi:hypothetical protein
MKKYKIVLPLLLAFAATATGQVSIKKTATPATSAEAPSKISQIKQVDGATKVQPANQAEAQGQTPLNKAAIIKSRGEMPEKRLNAPVYDFTNVKICVDKPNNYDPGPRPEKVYPKIPKINSNGQIVQSNTAQQPLTVETKKMWPTESNITVAFYPNEASNIIIEKVKQYARVWESVANIKFLFTNDLHNANIKVGFTPGGSWSWVGREVMYNPYGQKTMNFGWFKNDTPEQEFSRVVTHEFGHALGFIHEHQASTANIPWDAEKVYAFFAQSDNWSRTDVDRNIFYKYTQTSTRGTAYDPSSIMHYFFPAGLTTNNMQFTSNTALSPLDREFARSIYPFPPTTANASGVLHTGDDCDAINFTVEYNVVPANVIEVRLRAGIDNSGRPVSWWKQIGIPLKGGGENRNLQLNADGSTVGPQTILISDIDDTRGFSFAKAKVLGVHTGLGFTWNVWQALPGGCRVTFTWQNDHCYN